MENQKRITLREAAEQVLSEDPKTRDNKYLWLYISKVLRKFNIRFYIEFDKEKKLPSPDAMLTERRIILHNKNKFPEDFVPDPYATYEKPK